SRATCWQVFGLASLSAFAALLLSTASRLKRASACCGIVLAYRCGAASGFHRVPFFLSEKTQGTSTGAAYLTEGTMSIEWRLTVTIVSHFSPPADRLRMEQTPDPVEPREAPRSWDAV